MASRRLWMMATIVALALAAQGLGPVPPAFAASNPPEPFLKPNGTTTKLLLRDDVTIPDFVVDSGSVTNARMDSMVAFVDGFQRNSFALCQQEPQARTILSQVVLAEVFVPPLPTEYQLRVTSSYRDAVSAHPVSVWTFSSHDFASDGGGGYVLAQTPSIDLPLDPGGLNGVLRVAFEKRLSLTGSWSQLGWFEVGVTHVDCSGILGLLPCAKLQAQDQELTTGTYEVGDDPDYYNRRVSGTSLWGILPGLTWAGCSGPLQVPVGVPYGPDIGTFEAIFIKNYFGDQECHKIQRNLNTDAWYHDAGGIEFQLSSANWRGEFTVAFPPFGWISLGTSTWDAHYENGPVLGKHEWQFYIADAGPPAFGVMNQGDCTAHLGGEKGEGEGNSATEYALDAMDEPLEGPATATVCLLVLCESQDGTLAWITDAAFDFQFTFASPELNGSGQSKNRVALNHPAVQADA